MRLHVVHFPRLQSRAEQRRLDHLLLGGLARHRQPRTRPVLVERGPADDAPYPVAVRLGFAQPLQHEDAAALAPYVPVRGRVERLATPVRRQHPGVRPQFQQPPRQDRVHAPREREVRLAALQPGHRLVYRHERRRARGVHRYRRALQSQREGNSPDGRVERRARDRVEARRGVGGVADAQDEPPVLVVADPRVDPGAAALQRVRVYPRVFECPPARLQHQPLLWIQQLRLDRRDAEEPRVELVDVVDVRPEPARLGLHRRVGEQVAHATHARARNALDDRALARFELTPERREARRAGETARHPHHRYRLSGLPARHLCIPLGCHRLPPLTRAGSWTDKRIIRAARHRSVAALAFGPCIPLLRERVTRLAHGRGALLRVAWARVVISSEAQRSREISRGAWCRGAPCGCPAWPPLLRERETRFSARVRALRGAWCRGVPCGRPAWPPSPSGRGAGGEGSPALTATLASVSFTPNP